MKTLILDSATNLLYTALVVDSNVVYETYIPGKNDHASSIVLEISKACQINDIKLIDIEQIIVGYGPGSYTGVRMAVTVGKMIATLNEKAKLYTISTLLLMGSGSSGKVLACIDARRGNCFGCIYDFDKQSYLIPEALIEKEELMNNEFDRVVNESDFKVNPLLVIKLAMPVLEPRLLVPNYLRQTEAERNLHA